MALLGKQFRSRVAVMQNETAQYLEFDALISVSYAGAAQITDHPVENGADMSDHIRRRPKQIELSGIVSNDPIIYLASFRATPSVPGTNPAGRAEAAFKFLEDAQDRGLLMHVVTSMFDYEDMAITSLGCTRDVETGNVAAMSLSLREVQKATTETVAAVRSVTRPRNLGKRTKKAAPPAVEEKSAAMLHRLATAAGKLIGI